MRAVLRGGTVFAALALAVGASAGPVAAQGPIRTDRPGLTWPTAVLNQGEANLELGTPTLVKPAGGGDSWTYGNVYGRVGVAPHLELRASSDIVAASPGSGPTGMAGLRVGAKAGGNANGWDISVLPSVVFPVGNASLRPADPSYNLDVSWSHAVGSAALNVTTSIYSNSIAEGEHTTSGLIGAALSRTLSGPVAGYVEGGWFPADGPDAGILGTGLAWLTNDNVQLDAWLEAGVTDAAPDLQAGLGVSFRLSRGK